MYSPADGHRTALVALLGAPTPQYSLVQRHLGLVGLREATMTPDRKDRRRVAHLTRSIEVRFFAPSDLDSRELEELARAYRTALWHVGPLPSVSVAGRQLLTLVLEPTLEDLPDLSPSDRILRLHGAAALRAISADAPQDRPAEQATLAQGLGLIDSLATVDAEQLRWATESSLKMLQLDQAAEAPTLVGQGETSRESRLVCVPQDAAQMHEVLRTIDHPCDGFYAMWDQILQAEAMFDAEGNREIRGLRGRLVEQTQDIKFAEAQAADSMEKLEGKRRETKTANVASARLRKRVIELQEQIDDLKVEVAASNRGGLARPRMPLRTRVRSKVGSMAKRQARHQGGNATTDGAAAETAS